MLTPLEELEQEIYDCGIDIIERRPAPQYTAVYTRKAGQRPKIYIDPLLTTPSARYVVLAEELGHHYTLTGNILSQNELWQIKQEQAARAYAVHRCAPYAVILQMLREKYYPWEIAEWLYVPVWFLKTAFSYYQLHEYALSISDEYACA